MILPVFGPLGIMLFSNACIVHYIIIGGYPALAFVFISEFSIKYGFQFPHSLTISEIDFVSTKNTDHTDYTLDL